MVLLCSLDLGLVYNNLFFFIEPSLAVECGKADLRTDGASEGTKLLRH